MERNKNFISQDAQLLAKIYALILSWHDPPIEETASSQDLGQDKDEAAETSPTKMEGAS